MFCTTQPINDEPAFIANGGTTAFKCSSQEQALTFHRVALAHGGTTIEDAPIVRVSPIRSVFLAYVRDPDGNKLCAIHR